MEYNLSPVAENYLKTVDKACFTYSSSFCNPAKTAGPCSRRPGIHTSSSKNSSRCMSSTLSSNRLILLPSWDYLNFPDTLDVAPGRGWPYRH